MHKFIIFAHARSGSTTLLRMLNLHPSIDLCPFEPFNYQQKKELINTFKGEIKGSTTKFINKLYFDKYMDHILTHYIGFKHLWHQLQLEDNKRILSGHRNYKIIFLWRKNIIQAALSNVIARQTGVWQKYEKNLEIIKNIQYENINITKDEVARECEVLRIEIERYRNYLIEEKIDFLQVCYEDIFGNNISKRRKISNINKILKFTGRKQIKPTPQNLSVFLSLRVHGKEKQKLDKLLSPAATKILCGETYRMIPGAKGLKSLENREYGYLYETSHEASHEPL